MLNFLLWILTLLICIGLPYFLLFSDWAKASRQKSRREGDARGAHRRETGSIWESKILHVGQSRDPQAARELLEEFKNFSPPGKLSHIIGKHNSQKMIQVIATACIQDSDLIDYITRQITTNKYRHFLSGRNTEPYNLALRVLDENPQEPRAKKLVLEIGRWNFGKLRKGKGATIYDEQAIHNDLKVREQSIGTTEAR
jgi:hypothetical protein